MSSTPEPTPGDTLPATTETPPSSQSNTPVKGQKTVKKDKNDPARFEGEGVNFKAKLIGIDDVPDARGDKMCQETVQKLKMAIRTAKEHKQRIILNISVDGMKIIDEKTGAVNHTHPVHRISFISRDVTDARAFGYIFGPGDGKHKFFGIKTAQNAEGVVLALRDLFQYVFEMKKKEVAEAKKQQEEQQQTTENQESTYQVPTNNGPVSAAEGESAYAVPQNNAPVVAPKQEESSSSTGNLLNLETELETLQQGIKQIDAFNHDFWTSTEGSLGSGKSAPDPFVVNRTPAWGTAQMTATGAPGGAWGQPTPNAQMNFQANFQQQMPAQPGMQQQFGTPFGAPAAFNNPAPTGLPKATDPFNDPFFQSKPAPSQAPKPQFNSPFSASNMSGMGFNQPAFGAPPSQPPPAASKPDPFRDDPFFNPPVVTSAAPAPDIVPQGDDRYHGLDASLFTTANPEPAVPTPSMDPFTGDSPLVPTQIPGSNPNEIQSVPSNTKKSMFEDLDILGKKTSSFVPASQLFKAAEPPKKSLNELKSIPQGSSISSSSNSDTIDPFSVDFAPPTVTSAQHTFASDSDSMSTALSFGPSPPVPKPRSLPTQKAQKTEVSFDDDFGLPSPDAPPPPLPRQGTIDIDEAPAPPPRPSQSSAAPSALPRLPAPPVPKPRQSLLSSDSTSASGSPGVKQNGVQAGQLSGGAVDPFHGPVSSGGVSSGASQPFGNSFNDDFFSLPAVPSGQGASDPFGFGNFGEQIQEPIYATVNKPKKPT
ncbi:disabled homolog 1 [Lingula anatina]|uniref:Disabled homolog 1 n=1 Tax=Lingula anatina TaxID=7574 RepID=A0A1S3JB54_LINAN|nr:disabled homolog 1 [Lingula anatina]|eukprot:XP_013407635.1 disabled homolog 1 [Lingula anatina]